MSRYAATRADNAICNGTSMVITDSEKAEVLRAVDILYTAAGNALYSFTDVRLHNHRFEATWEALLLHVVVGRHTEAFCASARDGLNLLPSAQVLARSAFEISVRAQWMLRPSDPFEREMRWLALLEEWENDTAQAERDNPTSSAQAKAKSTELSTFRVNVEALLIERGHRKVKGRIDLSGRIVTPVPSFSAMLKDLGVAKKYAAYSRLSKPVHGTLGATARYRCGLGTEKVFTEEIRAIEWLEEIKVVWEHLDSLTGRIAEVLIEHGTVHPSERPYVPVDDRAELTRILSKASNAATSQRATLSRRSIRRLTGQ